MKNTAGKSASWEIATSFIVLMWQLLSKSAVSSELYLPHFLALSTFSIHCQVVFGNNGHSFTKDF